MAALIEALYRTDCRTRARGAVVTTVAGAVAAGDDVAGLALAPRCPTCNTPSQSAGGTSPSSHSAIRRKFAGPSSDGSPLSNRRASRPVARFECSPRQIEVAQLALAQ